MSAPDRQRWLFGPFSDLTLGCGLGYAALFTAFLVAGTQNVSTLTWVPLISIFTGTPHYGATLLRVYEQRSERRAYAFFSVWMTLLVWGVFYLGLYDVLVGSLLLTLYLSWSPWHYSGQNYGIAVMFLRRRGIEVTPLAKRALYGSFLLSFLLALLALHGAAGSGEYAAVQPYRGGAFTLMRLGIPSPYWDVLFFGLGAAYLASLGVALRELGARARLADLVPMLALVVTQALWFAMPIAMRHFGLLAGVLKTDAAFAFFWVATGHTVQYIWITTYYAARDGGLAARTGFFVKALLAGSFIWSVPALIYTWTVEGTRLGGPAMGPDVAVLIASAVNIHHFILDGAIWKLRDGRVAQVLIRREATPEAPAPTLPLYRRWGALSVYGLGAFATVTVLAALGERELRMRGALASGDLAGVSASLERLERIGHAGADDYLRAGRAAAQRKSHREALHYFERSLQKHPNPRTWIAIGQLEHSRRRHDQARAAFERALEINPNQPDALYLLGLEWLRRDEPERALDLLEHAAAIAPSDPQVAASVTRARNRLALLDAAPRADDEEQL